MTCTNSESVFEIKDNKSRNLLQVSGFISTFALALKIVVIHSAGRRSYARHTSTGFFNAQQHANRRLHSRKIELPFG